MMAITIDPKSWAGASERDKMLARSGKDVMTARAREVADAISIEKVIDISGLKAFAEEVSKEPEKFLGSILSISDAVIDFLLTKVTGLNIPDGALKAAIQGDNSEEVRRAFGSILLAFLDENLDVDKVAQGFANRTPGEGERDSMSRLLGTAFRIQAGDMAMDWITQALPFGLASGLKDVAERFNDAMNLDDALEDIIQVPMQEVIEKGLQQWYARKIKPVDLTDSQARQALLQERITEDIYNKVLDNNGVRDDIRAPLLEMARPNLTESDIDQAYQRNLIDEAKVEGQYKDRGFQGEEREIKKQLVLKNRRWKLEERILELYGNLYRDDVALKPEVTPFLEHLGYEPDEIEMWFQVQELERRQRKWLSAAQCNNLAKAGLVKPDFLIDYEVKQGMLPEDAMLLYMNQLLAQFPAPTPADPNQTDECAQIIKDAFTLDKFLSALLAKIPIFDTGGIFSTGDVKKLLECLIKQAQNP